MSSQHPGRGGQRPGAGCSRREPAPVIRVPVSQVPAIRARRPSPPIAPVMARRAAGADTLLRPAEQPPPGPVPCTSPVWRQGFPVRRMMMWKASWI